MLFTIIFGTLSFPMKAVEQRAAEVLMSAGAVTQWQGVGLAIMRSRVPFQVLAQLLYVRRSTQPCTPPGSLNRTPALLGVKAGMSPLPAGR